MGRSTLAVDDRIANELHDKAKMMNTTEFSLVNNIIETFIDIVNTGAEIKTIIPAVKLASFVKNMNSFPLPEDIIEAMVSKLYEGNKEWLGKLWFELGKKLGIYAKTYLKDLSELESEANAFITLVPIRYVKIEKPGPGQNCPISITILGGWKEPLSFAIGSVIAGFMSIYNCEVKEIKTGHGFISVHAQQKI